MIAYFWIILFTKNDLSITLSIMQLIARKECMERRQVVPWKVPNGLAMSELVYFVFFNRPSQVELLGVIFIGRWRNCVFTWFCMILCNRPDLSHCENNQRVSLKVQMWSTGELSCCWASVVRFLVFPHAGLRRDHNLAQRLVFSSLHH